MRSTYNIKTEKKLKLERMAIDLSSELGKTIKWTDIMEILVDRFSKDACEFILKSESLENRKVYKSTENVTHHKTVTK